MANQRASSANEQPKADMGDSSETITTTTTTASQPGGQTNKASNGPLATGPAERHRTRGFTSIGEIFKYDILFIKLTAGIMFETSSRTFNVVYRVALMLASRAIMYKYYVVYHQVEGPMNQAGMQNVRVFWATYLAASTMLFVGSILNGIRYGQLVSLITRKRLDKRLLRHRVYDDDDQDVDVELEQVDSCVAREAYDQVATGGQVVRAASGGLDDNHDNDTKPQPQHHQPSTSANSSSTSATTSVSFRSLMSSDTHATQASTRGLLLVSETNAMKVAAAAAAATSLAKEANLGSLGVKTGRWISSQFSVLKAHGDAAIYDIKSATSFGRLDRDDDDNDDDDDDNQFGPNLEDQGDDGTKGGAQVSGVSTSNGGPQSVVAGAARGPPRRRPARRKSSCVRRLRLLLVCNLIISTISGYARDELGRAAMRRRTRQLADQRSRLNESLATYARRWSTGPLDDGHHQASSATTSSSSAMAGFLSSVLANSGNRSSSSSTRQNATAPTNMITSNISLLQSSNNNSNNMTPTPNRRLIPYLKARLHINGTKLDSDIRHLGDLIEASLGDFKRAFSRQNFADSLGALGWQLVKLLLRLVGHFVNSAMSINQIYGYIFVMSMIAATITDMIRETVQRDVRLHSQPPAKAAAATATSRSASKSSSAHCGASKWTQNAHAPGQQGSDAQIFTISSTTNGQQTTTTTTTMTTTTTTTTGKTPLGDSAARLREPAMLTTELLLQTRDILVALREALNLDYLLLMVFDMSRLSSIFWLFFASVASNQVFTATTLALDYLRVAISVFLTRIGYHWLHSEVVRLRAITEHKLLETAVHVHDIDGGSSGPGVGGGGGGGQAAGGAGGSAKSAKTAANKAELGNKLQSAGATCASGDHPSRLVISRAELTTTSRLAKEIEQLWPTDWFTPDFRSFVSQNFYVVTFVATLQQLVEANSKAEYLN